MADFDSSISSTMASVFFGDFGLFGDFGAFFSFFSSLSESESDDESESDPCLPRETEVSTSSSL